jgi:hypothetical protein
MVGKLIEIDNDKAIVKPVCWTIKPLRDVIDFFPEEYDRVIHFLHCMISLNPVDNPFADIATEEKEEKILRYLDLDIDTNNDIIKDGLECVYSVYSTPLYRSYETLQVLRDQINFKLKSIQLDFEANGNSSNVTTMIKSLSVYNKELREAKKAYLEEQGEIRGRGGVEMAYDENDDDDLFGEDDDSEDDD